MRRILAIAVATMALAQAALGQGVATCTREDYARTVDAAGASLRKINADNAPRLQAKMRQLMDRKGWSDETALEKAFSAVHDERIAQLDDAANDLLAKIDTLGTPGDQPDCARLEELKATSLELQATVKAKSAYTLAKLDQMLAEPIVTPAPPAKTKTAVAKKIPPPAPKSALVVPPKPPEESGWSTTTTGEPRRDAAIGPPEDEGYTIDEVRAASEGLFGKVSANLGSVIEHLFKNSGRPAGYVLGAEGGGAFLAGVRYGKGTLYLRSGGTQKIYWHGPSLGTDVGADGSKTMFLIYKLKSADQLYASFTGIDGSAYFVGGIGATLVTNGSVVMAPIRAGVGLRLGANIGYIRFTPRATWNPF